MNEGKEGTLSNYYTQTFAILDKWLNNVAEEKGEQALQAVKKAVENNLNANVTYYEDVAKEADRNGEHQLATRNRLLAKLYSELL